MIVGLAAFAVGAALHFLNVFQALEWKSWDARLRLFADPERAGGDIVLILVDQYSLDVYEAQQGLSWPWPRQLYAVLIEYLKTGGSAACFFDIAMTEGSRFGVEDDEILAGAAVAAGNAFFPVALSTEEKENGKNSLELLRRFSLESRSVALKEEGTRFLSVTTPLEIFLNSAKGVGNVRVNPDGDGIYRRMPLVFSSGDMVLPSVPLALSEHIAGQQDLSSIPVDPSGQMMIRFWGPTGTYKTYPVAAIINSWAQIQEGQAPQIPPKEFAGKVVLVGLSAVGLYDIKSSPLSAVIPGVEIQAAALDTLLHRNFIRVVPEPVSHIFVFLLALLTGVAVSSFRKIWAVVAAFGVALAFPAGAACAAFAAGLWLEFVFPWTSVFVAMVGASVLNYSIEGKQRRFIKGVFSHYLSPAVIDRLIDNPKLLCLGGEEREITSFFSDIAGFTTISEKLDPQELVSLLNTYLSEMTDIILDQGGTLDKYEGDAIVAFWNAPLDDPRHAARACRAALACQKKVAEIEPEFKKRFGHGIRMRIGLSSGPAVVGNMGSSRRFDYTAMGDTVNLAARLESACKQYGTNILMAENTIECVRDEVVVREVDVVRVVGKSRPVRVFELVGEKGDVSREKTEELGIFHEALGHYRKREWDRALDLFKTLSDDPLAALYIGRSLKLKQNPPSEDWDHVAELVSK